MMSTTPRNAETAPPPTPAVIPDAAAYWGKHTHTYTCLHVRLRLILDAVVAARPASLFELGCGVGVFRKELLRCLPGVKYWGCDVSETAVKEIGDPQVVRADLNVDGVPFPEMRVDCIVGSGILEYVRDLEGTLVQLRKRLNPGGRLLVSYFNFRHIFRRFVEFRGRKPFRNPTWAHDHTPAGFQKVLTNAGFVVRDVCPNNLGFGGSPSIGNERWSPGPLRALRKVPGIRLFAHQLIFHCVSRA